MDDFFFFFNNFNSTFPIMFNLHGNCLSDHGFEYKSPADFFCLTTYSYVHFSIQESAFKVNMRRFLDSIE